MFSLVVLNLWAVALYILLLGLIRVLDSSDSGDVNTAARPHQKLRRFPAPKTIGKRSERRYSCSAVTVYAMLRAIHLHATPNTMTSCRSPPRPQLSRSRNWHWRFTSYCSVSSWRRFPRFSRTPASILHSQPVMFHRRVGATWHA